MSRVLFWQVKAKRAVENVMQIPYGWKYLAAEYLSDRGPSFMVSGSMKITRVM